MLYTYRTAAQRVGRSERIIRRWRRQYNMRVTIDQEAMAIIEEAELLRCYRLALSRSNQIKHRKHEQYRDDTLPLLGYAQL